jgi:PAS domain S-box-containing protein
MFIYDVETLRFLEVNQAALELYGYSKDAFLRMDLTDLYTTEDIQTLLYVSEVKEGEFTGPWKHKKSGGGSILVEINLSRIQFNGKNAHLSFIKNTVQSKTDSQRAYSGKLDKNAYKEIDENFFSNIFHDILTPINAILGFAQYLSESIEKPNEEQTESLTVISENRLKLLQTMDAVVEYFHILQEDENLASGTIFVRDLIENIKPDVAKGISGDVEFEYEIPENFIINGDIRKLQTFLTLLFALLGRITPAKNISASLKRTSDKGMLELRGPEDMMNQSYEIRNNLYALFTLPEADSAQKFGASKLTIRLLKKLLQDLKAEFEIGDISALGNTFVIKFPLIMHAEKKVRAIKELKNSGAEMPQTDAPGLNAIFEPAISGLSCLYVEDQIDSQILFKSQMKDMKRIDSALSFEDSIVLLEKNNYDFIVMDINLQGEYNGLDALKIIRQLKDYANVPVIAVTAYALPGDKEKFLKTGFSDFIPKPVSRQNLINSLSLLLPALQK